ncbi:MAG: VWA domain-containing protein [Myxococcales bacterium]|nr:VWA domain-containing protein [Myxococcales bacterium]MCB9648878.1 VWA domain-containing protein [Deltaproteobacteria bacterium]
MPDLARWAALGILGGALVGCQDYRFEQKCPEGITESQITVPAAPPVPVDILFVVDNSGSMADEQENLATNFNSFIDQVAGSVDYRIGVVTTDLDTNGGEQQGLSIPTWSTSEYATLISTDQGGCGPTSPAIAHGCFRGDNENTRIIDSSAMTKDEQIAAFRANVRVGSCGSGQEKGLDAMVRALEQMRPGQCNAGFLRDEANLVVIFVSDEDAFGNTNIQQFVQDLTGVKAADKVRVGAIVGAVDGQAGDCSAKVGGQCGSLCDGPAPDPGSNRTCARNNDCDAEEFCNGGRCRSLARFYWDDSPENCSWCTYFNVADCCSALSGGRYLSFARAVEQAVVAANSDLQVHQCNAPVGTRAACLVDSICQDNFGETLKRMANELVVTNEYRLTPAPINPDGVSVTVVGGRFGDGETLEYGTQFSVTLDATGDSAKLLITDGTKVPGVGEDVKVSYVTEISKPTEQKGACGPQTTTDAGN